MGGEGQQHGRHEGVPHHANRRHRFADRCDHDVLHRAAAFGEGSFNIIAINEAAVPRYKDAVSHTLVLWCAVGLLLAIIGKSGQFPLHTL